MQSLITSFSLSMSASTLCDPCEALLSADFTLLLPSVLMEPPDLHLVNFWTPSSQLDKASKTEIGLSWSSALDKKLSHTETAVPALVVVLTIGARKKQEFASCLKIVGLKFVLKTSWKIYKAFS